MAEDAEVSRFGILALPTTILGVSPSDSESVPKSLTFSSMSF